MSLGECCPRAVKGALNQAVGIPHPHPLPRTAQPGGTCSPGREAKGLACCSQATGLSFLPPGRVLLGSDLVVLAGAPPCSHVSCSGRFWGSLGHQRVGDALLFSRGVRAQGLGAGLRPGGLRARWSSPGLTWGAHGQLWVCSTPAPGHLVPDVQSEPWPQAGGALPQGCPRLAGRERVEGGRGPRGRRRWCLAAAVGGFQAPAPGSLSQLGVMKRVPREPQGAWGSAY